MRKEDNDIRRITDGLRSGRRFRNANLDKLLQILERSELHVPQGLMMDAADAPRLREIAPTALSSARKRRRLSVPTSSIVRWALVPACAAAAALIFFFAWPRLFRGEAAGTAIAVSGDVRLLSAGAHRTLREGDDVGRDDVILSGPSSRADISFPGGLVLRVLPGSRVSLLKTYVTGRKRTFDALVTGGGCIMRVSRLEAGESALIHTPTSVASVKGTMFGVRVDADGTVRYEVYEGTVRVRRCLPPDRSVEPEAAMVLERYFEDAAVELKASQACRIGTDRKPLYALTGSNVRNALPDLSIPVIATGTACEMQLPNEAAGFPGMPGAGIAARPAPEPRGSVYLMYVPDLDFVLKIGKRYIALVRSQETRWSLDLDGTIASLPVFESTSLYVSTVSGAAMKIDLYTGKILWTAHMDDSMHPRTSPVLDESGLYCATVRGLLYKFDHDGRLLWRSDIGCRVTATPVCSGSHVFVPAADGRLIGVDGKTGAASVGASFGSGIAALGARADRIFVATEAGSLFCYRHRDGKTLWRYEIAESINGDMLVRHGSIYMFGRGGTIYRISADGLLLWSRDTGRPIVKRPAEDESRLYIPAGGVLLSVDKKTGDIARASLEPAINSGNVAVTKDTIYFESEKSGFTSLRK
ncbi:MAG: PQQ-binding-like beta-propeller repeat protein [Spirochaetes bacterium]|nr:PQQ-binding-like beta-propeller repeat protein [Spirochaetota bacterium]